MRQILLDSDILIFSQKAEYSVIRTKLIGKRFNVSLITKLEALGYHQINPGEQALLRTIISAIPVLPINDELIDMAITLRQQQKMQTADAIIAATALTHGLELWTNNVKDFKHVANLKIYNPLEDEK